MTQSVLSSTAPPEQALPMASTLGAKAGSALAGESATRPFIDVMALLQQQDAENRIPTALSKQAPVAEGAAANPSQDEPHLDPKQLFASLPLASAKKERHATSVQKDADAWQQQPQHVVSMELPTEAFPTTRIEPVFAVPTAVPQQNVVPAQATEPATAQPVPPAASAAPWQANEAQSFAPGNVVKMAELTTAPAHEAFQLLVQRAGREGENKPRVLQATTIASLTGRANALPWDGNTRAIAEVSLPQTRVAQQESRVAVESLPEQNVDAQPALQEAQALPQAVEEPEARAAQGQSATRAETETPRAAKQTPGQPESNGTLPAQTSQPVEATAYVAASEDKLAAAEPQADAPVLETRSVQVPDDVVNNTTPVREVTVRLDAQGESVQVRLAERDGTLQVTVRSPQAEVAEVLRRDLDVLVDALQRTGYNAESAPASVEGASEMTGQPELKMAETMPEEQQDRQARPEWDWEWLMRNKRKGK